jgi:hypothetical protein
LRPSSREGANGGCPNDLNDATHATRRRKIVENVRKSSRTGIARQWPNHQRHQVGDVRRRIAAKRWRTRSPQRSLHHGAKSVASSGRTGRYGLLGVMPTEFLKLNARPIGRSPGPKIDLIANPKTALDSAWASFDSHNDKVWNATRSGQSAFQLPATAHRETALTPSYPPKVCCINLTHSQAGPCDAGLLHGNGPSLCAGAPRGAKEGLTPAAGGAVAPLAEAAAPATSPSRRNHT